MAIQQINPQYNVKGTTQNRGGSAAGAVGDFLKGVAQLNFENRKQEVAQDQFNRELDLKQNQLVLDQKKADDTARYQDRMGQYYGAMESKMAAEQEAKKGARENIYGLAKGVATSDVERITESGKRDFIADPLSSHEQTVLNAQGVLGESGQMEESAYKTYLKTIGQTIDTTVQFDKSKNQYFKDIVSTGTGRKIGQVQVEDPNLTAKTRAATSGKREPILDAGSAERWAENKLRQDELGGKKFAPGERAQLKDSYKRTALITQTGGKFKAFEKNIGEPVSINNVMKEVGSIIKQYGQEMTVTGKNTVRINDDEQVSGATYQGLINSTEEGALKDALEGFDTNIGLKNFSGQKDYNLMLSLTGSKSSSEAWIKDMARNAAVKPGGFPSFFARLPMVKTFMAGIAGEKPKDSQVYSFYRGLAELNAQGRLNIHKDRDSKVDTSGRAVRNVTAFNPDGSEMTNSDIIKYGVIGTTEAEEADKIKKATTSTSLGILPYD